MLGGITELEKREGQQWAVGEKHEDKKYLELS